MHLFSAIRYSTKTCLNSTLLRPPKPSVTNRRLTQHLARVSPRHSCPTFRRTFAFSSRSLQKPTLRTGHDREPKETTKPNVSGKPQVVGAEKIWTIPNGLTISRILSCPVLGYAILHDDFYVATGLLVYAGLTDLVRV